MAPNKNQQKHQVRPRGGEPKLLGDILMEYALGSDEPFALLLRKCINCPGGDSCDSTPNTSLYDWVDNQEVERTLNISARTLQNLRTQGILPYTIFGGRCFYKRADLERLLEQGYRVDGNSSTYVTKGGWRDDH